MYIVKKTDSFSVENNINTEAQIAELKAPRFEENGEIFSLCEVGANTYDGYGFTAKDTVTVLGRGLFSVERTVTNNGDVRKVKLIAESETCFAPKKYLIPCVSYNGNEYGDGKEPKGMMCEGQPWIHSYDRTSIPSCTVTENKDVAFTMFVSNRDTDSLRSSCSVIPGEKEGELIQRIYWPVTEAPYTYSDNDKLTERYDEYLTLENGQSFTVLFYVLASVPRWENYGSNEVFDRALEIFKFDKKPNLSTSDIWWYGILYTRFLLHDIREVGPKIFCMGVTNTKDGLVWSDAYEIGWVGQNIMNARFLIKEYIRTGEKRLLDEALVVCDEWVRKQFDNGLVLARFQWYKEGRNWDYVPFDPNKTWAANVPRKTGWLPETCNMGWSAAEFIKVWDLLRSIGVDKPEYKEFALKVCDFFCDRYSEEYAFGKSWHHITGECDKKDGSIGGFMTMGLIEVYKVLGEKRYLDYALKSLDFYFERDLNNFVCTAGAVDCSCVDKETAGPFIIASLDAYEITGDKKYIEYAEKAAYYFNSWMFVYDIHYGPEAEFTTHGYYTTGGTSVSVQHPAIDQWGELMCCEYLRLYKYTGNKLWYQRMLMMWYNSTQCICTSPDQLFHGRHRPLGGQNEAFYHCRWGHRKDCNDRGHLNEWLVSWVNVFRLNVLDRLTTVCGEEDWSIFD